ncbi:EamA family transporter [Arsenicicoccus sp. oral taxon 190]|uniref:EamA family transporter n=1 Tax=Arsenicicoccus sp. oral taxon 190 TaxID=1658671 RepID=UPI000679FED5|nr:EamA family transporter [Arsenicicoccus sp. oral taxon 190]AKT52801.1 membrane protein [Arsenicicoccus sp. oral taxon 190]
MPASPATRSGADAPSPRAATPLLLVLAAIVSVQFGGALAALLVAHVGPAATVTLRLALAVLIMLAVSRPRLRGHSRAAWLAVVAFGVSLALMNSTFYASLARLPIGVAVTIEFVGPLALAAVLSRRLSDALAVTAALGGVALISGALTVPWHELDHVGIAYAAAAGACWAAYILCSQRVGHHFPQLEGLTLAMIVAALLVAPLGLVTLDPARLSWGLLGAGLGVALLSSVLPYSFELLALRRLDARVFGVLLSLEPATAALAGFVVLGQRLSPLQLAGMALVVVASAIVMGARRRGPDPAGDSAEVG